jgi:hypothetical protein
MVSILDKKSVSSTIVSKETHFGWELPLVESINSSPSIPVPAPGKTTSSLKVRWDSSKETMTVMDSLDTPALLASFTSLIKTETETAFVQFYLSLVNYNPNSEIFLGVCTSNDLLLTLKPASAYTFKFVAYDSDDGS